MASLILVTAAAKYERIYGSYSRTCGQRQRQHERQSMTYELQVVRF